MFVLDGELQWTIGREWRLVFRSAHRHRLELYFPAPRDHIVQLYQDQQFLNRAVCRFAAAAIANGEGVILVPTIAHWDAFRPRLEDEGVDVKAAQRRGQLTIVDADNLLPTFMRDGMPDSPMFLGLAANVITQARGDGRYPKVRWWGEMVNLLWERGDVAASMNLEDLFDQLAHEHDIAIFCSFLMDNFNGDVHARMLPRLGENHSHLIPVEDYARLERAVSEALRETVGPDESRVLEATPLALPRFVRHAADLRHCSWLCVRLSHLSPMMCCGGVVLCIRPIKPIRRIELLYGHAGRAVWSSILREATLRVWTGSPTISAFSMRSISR